jgi:hypothetical protein
VSSAARRRVSATRRFMHPKLQSARARRLVRDSKRPARTYFSSYLGISCETPEPQRLTLSSWRKAVAWCLEELGPSVGWTQARARAERFAACGRAAREVVRECIHADDGQLFVPLHCDLRVCPECARRRSRHVARVYSAVLRRVVDRLPTHLRLGRGWRPKSLPADTPAGRNWRLVTLTRRNPGGYDPERLRAQVRDTRRLATELWRDTWGSHRAERVTAAAAGVGAVFGLEVSPFTSAGGGGMVHVHMLVYGHYWPQDDLSRRWLKLTGDSHIVDIRQVRISPRKLAKLKAEGIRPTADHVLRAGVLECLKYATKPPTGDSLEDARAVAAIEYAYAGTRRLGTLGIFYNQVSETLDDPEYTPELAGLVCPCCHAPARAGQVVGRLFLESAFARGASWYTASMAANPPPTRDQEAVWEPPLA